MANLEETEIWEDGIYQFEETDFIEGGANGIDNLPHKQLGARTKFLKVKTEEIEAEIENLVSNNYTKAEIDTLLQGLKPKASVKVATTANITLSGTQTIDTIAVAVGDRVLVKDQTTASQNGIYIVSASAWTRSLDTNTAVEVTGAFVFVEQGTTNADTAWVQTTDNVTLNTTSLVWVKFAGNGAFQAASTILSAIAALTSGVGYLSFNNGVVSIDTGKPAGEWVDVTASRTIGVTYSNTGSKPIYVHISAISTNASLSNRFDIEINGVALKGSYAYNSSTLFQNSAIVFPGDTYKYIALTTYNTPLILERT
ncbi:hypothetical protein, putative prophage head decoration protein [Sulfurovum sp. enrichment culture clone C5]|uniref:Uncharacterized protein n=1 Tax=Sulfurovum sp. enrichment culture clone C5 TaxID=497650 RepID=A0A0S4XM98_9BACT|nr:hypothetical protein, putative prophage head decoration protein [Sulfurovum sp. enrichment culture clone C5]